MNAADSIIFDSAQSHHHDISHIYWDFQSNSTVLNIFGYDDNDII